MQIAMHYSYLVRRLLQTVDKYYNFDVFSRVTISKSYPKSKPSVPFKCCLLHHQHLYIPKYFARNSSRKQISSVWLSAINLSPNEAIKIIELNWFSLHFRDLLLYPFFICFLWNYEGSIFISTFTLYYLL